ncbi:MAG: VWA domain-containing protein, partial [Clostridia bacterium]|nr:VWA domain-containing protein [Clostridia bacterium]
MTTKTKLSKRLMSFLLCVILLMSYLPVSMLASAASYTYKGGAGETIVDLDTSTKYSLSLGDNASTEYAGRIWTDKSVYNTDVVFNTYGGGTSTVKLNDDKNGEDFLVAYSTLATAQAVSGETQAPIDVVFVIDISGSMSNDESSMDNGYSRIYNTVQAVNASITKLMNLNKYTRIGVVAFSNQYQVLLPLGRYSKVDNEDYFTLSKRTAAEYIGQGYNRRLESIYLYTNAVRENGEDELIEKTTQVSGGTNIQMGLYGGLNMLASEQDVYATMGDNRVKRIPSVILLSDGSPTYSSSTTNWWAPSNNNNDGPGSSPYAGNGMKALMTGAYMKQQVDKHYGVAGTNYATSIYTVGMGITNLPNYSQSGNRNYYTGEKDLANITLNPKGYWTADNDMSNAIESAWNTYTTNNGRPSMNVSSNDTFTFSHPNSNDIDTDANALKNLINDYYAADNASAVTTVFDAIVSNISITVPQIPTEIKGEDPLSDGYITYTDPIGKYMEVKDVKAIIYAGSTFTQKSVNSTANSDTYIFEGRVESAVYGNQEIKNIVITVTEDASKNQTLVIKIPASVIPLRVNTVQLNSDGTVKTHSNNGAYPARVIYSVGLKSEILKESDDGVVYVDRTKISSDYLANNTDSNGNINFYSNLYTGENVVNGSTSGNATVEFEPSHTNSFYYIQEDMPIYKDKEFKNQVRISEGLDDDTVYYYRDEYYHGVSVEVAAIERTGTQLKKTTIKQGADGYLYRAVGSP